MSESPGVMVRNWSEFQHYKHRNPPWIKLHKSLLDNPEYFTLEPEAAKALPLLWLIASERDGTLPDAHTLAFRLRLDVHAIVDILKSLCDNDFLVDASNVLASCKQLASQSRVEESRGEAETETEKSNNSLGAPTKKPDIWPAKPRKIEGAYRYPEEFEAAWAAYPKRDGSNPKVGAYKAFRARVRSGDDPHELVASAEHYRKSVVAAGKDGTVFVSQAATFWGPSEPWREFVQPYTPNANGKPHREPIPLPGGGFSMNGIVR